MNEKFEERCGNETTPKSVPEEGNGGNYFDPKKYLEDVASLHGAKHQLDHPDELNAIEKKTEGLLLSHLYPITPITEVTYGNSFSPDIDAFLQSAPYQAYADFTAYMNELRAKLEQGQAITEAEADALQKKIDLIANTRDEGLATNMAWDDVAEGKEIPPDLSPYAVDEFIFNSSPKKVTPKGGEIPLDLSPYAVATADPSLSNVPSSRTFIPEIIPSDGAVSITTPEPELPTMPESNSEDNGLGKYNQPDGNSGRAKRPTLNPELYQTITDVGEDEGNQEERIQKLEPAVRARLYERVTKRINKIESRGLLDRWLNDRPGVLAVFGDLPFDNFKQLPKASIRDIRHLLRTEYGNLNKVESVSADTVRAWAKYIDKLTEHAETLPADKRTTEAVIQSYFEKQELNKLK